MLHRCILPAHRSEHGRKQRRGPVPRLAPIPRACRAVLDRRFHALAHLLRIEQPAALAGFNGIAPHTDRTAAKPAPNRPSPSLDLLPLHTGWRGRLWPHRSAFWGASPSARLATPCGKMPTWSSRGSGCCWCALPLPCPCPARRCHAPGRRAARPQQPRPPAPPPPCRCRTRRSTCRATTSGWPIPSCRRAPGPLARRLQQAAVLGALCPPGRLASGSWQDLDPASPRTSLSQTNRARRRPRPASRSALRRSTRCSAAGGRTLTSAPSSSWTEACRTQRACARRCGAGPASRLPSPAALALHAQEPWP